MIHFKLKIVLLGLIITILSSGAIAQKTAIYDQPSANYQDALALFVKQQYGPSQQLFQKTINNIDDKYSIMRIDAEYYKALCAVELFNDDAELLLLKFIEKHPESMHLKHIYFQLGKFQYRKKSYRRALKSFENVDVYDLSKEEQTEFYFKRGYSYFKKDSIELAKKNFYEIINNDSRYKGPAVYYYSHIAYNEANYETARKGFISLKDDKAFSPIIPYYVTHIYYMQKKYDELLKVAPQLLERSTPKRKPEISRIIGEAYYRTERYKESIPYLKSYYNASMNKISETNLYQMAYANFKIGDYNEAISYFKKIESKDTEMAQSANYHLAICYVKVNKKSYALNAFNFSYNHDFDADITADALYNFAKISYELDYNPYNQALKAFEKYVTEYPESVHRNDAMSYLTKMYLSTNNYEQALSSIEKIQDKSPELLLAYQRILYSTAVTKYNASRYEEAITFFDKSLALNVDKSFTAKSLFWKAESYFKQKKFVQCISNYELFLTSPGAFSEPNYNQAHYNIAYSHFYQKHYKKSNGEFRIFVQNEKDNKSVFVNDAYNRIGDSYFIQEEYLKAVESYNLALAIAKHDVDYTLYKKAEALGPLKRAQEKANTFEKLVNEYPNSTYAGNAEYALAQLYNVDLQDKKKAINYYDHIIATRPQQTSYVKKAKLDLGYIYSSIDTKKSITIFKKLYQDYEGSEEAKNALSALQNIYSSEGNVDEFFKWAQVQGVQVSLSTQDSANYYVAEDAFMSREYSTAITKLGHYIERFPTGYFISKAHYQRAQCYYNTKKYVEALQDFKYIADKPVSKYTEESMTKISHINFNIFHDYPASRIAYVNLRNISESKQLHYDATVNIMKCDVETESYDSILSSANDVLLLPELSPELETTAKMNIARTYMVKGNFNMATPILREVSKTTTNQESSEALYNLAYIDYENQQYDSAEIKTYQIAQQQPSFEIWVVKAFILSSDIFMKTDNMHQAKATLTSIVENYDGDEGILNQAKEKLKIIEQIQAEKENKEEPQEMIIDLGQDNDLFIETDQEIETDFEETLEEEEIEE